MMNVIKEDKDFTMTYKEDMENQPLDLLKLPCYYFAGTSDDIDVYFEWEHKMTEFFALCDYPEFEKVFTAAAQLIGDAQNWWDKEIIAGKHSSFLRRPTWDAMKTLMRKQYIPRDMYQDIRKQFWTLKQGDKTIMEYQRQFNYLRMRLNSEVRNENIIYHFVDGLSDDIRCELQGFKYYDLEELFQETIQIEVLRTEPIQGGGNDEDISTGQSIHMTDRPSVLPTDLAINPTSQSNCLTDHSINPTVHPSSHPTVHPSSHPTVHPSRPPAVHPSRPPAVNPSCPPAVLPSSPPAVLPFSPPIVRPFDPPIIHSYDPLIVRPYDPPIIRPYDPPILRPYVPPKIRPSCRLTIRSTHRLICPSRRLSIRSSHRLSIRQSRRLSICPFRRLSICPSRMLSICPSHMPSIRPFGSPSLRPSGLPDIHPSVHPPNYQGNNPFILPRNHPSIRPSNGPPAKSSVDPSI